MSQAGRLSLLDSSLCGRRSRYTRRAIFNLCCLNSGQHGRRAVRLPVGGVGDGYLLLRLLVLRLGQWVEGRLPGPGLRRRGAGAARGEQAVVSGGATAACENACPTCRLPYAAGWIQDGRRSGRLGRAGPASPVSQLTLPNEPLKICNREEGATYITAWPATGTVAESGGERPQQLTVGLPLAAQQLPLPSALHRHGPSPCPASSLGPACPSTAACPQGRCCYC